jgi:NADH-quinone oxidoreductase subunit M
LEFNYLTSIIFLPALGGIVIALLNKPQPKTVKMTAAAFALVTFLLTLAVFLIFDRSPGVAFQFEEKVAWVPSLGINYHLGVDGLSLPLVLLTGFLGILVILISWGVTLRVKEFFVWLLVLETSLLGVFTALDLVLFFIFWEIELVPMYFLISIWGSGRKEYSAMKYLIYTVLGSAMMLIGILSVYFSAGTFSMVELTQTNWAMVKAVMPLTAVFFFLIFAFVVKLPVFPFHTWLPDAHTDAPTAVSVMLAGVLLKMGGYGIIRVAVSIFPDIAHQYAVLFIVLAVVNVLYGAAVTLRQTDLKRMIAYSSVSHMGYVLLGIFALSNLSLVGASLQMFSHGVVTGLLFAMVGLVYEHSHHRDLRQLGGLARQMPIAAAVFVMAGLASLGLPGTSGFAAEFLVFLGSYGSTAVEGIRLYTILGVSGIVITAGYVLYMLQRTFYNQPQEKFNEVRDASLLERVPIFSLVVAIMLVGIYPAVLTDVIKRGIEPVMRLLGS